MTEPDREALTGWVATRVAVALLALGTLWTVAETQAGNVHS